MSKSLLKVDNIVVRHIAAKGGWLVPSRQLTAVDGVSFELAEGQTLGVVGESGCGKSTLARALLGLVPLSSGSIIFGDQTLGGRSQRALKPWRRAMRIVFQDPVGSLDPRMTVGDAVAEPLTLFEPELDANGRRERVLEILERVGIGAECYQRYPHEFSGGQCQRIGIARSLISKPRLLICDEPVSALDVSIRAQIINLLQEIQETLGLSLIFIAHDLSVVRYISHYVLVMYLGRLAEYADTKTLFDMPHHPYTQALIRSMPIPRAGAKRYTPGAHLGTDIPSLSRPPSGCRFRTRCEFAKEQCASDVPEVRAWQDSQVACHRAEEIPKFRR